MKLLNAATFLFLSASFAAAALNHVPAMRSELFFKTGADYDRYLRRQRNKEDREAWRR